MDCEKLSSEGLTPLMEAAQSGKVAIARFLLSNGADVNAQAKRGVTALILAASRCRPAIVGLLLKHGASIEYKALGNKTALDVAAAAGDWASMRLLLRADGASRVPGYAAAPRARRHVAV